MCHYFPLPEGRTKEQHHPKPPNIVIAADSWEECVIATAAYTLLLLAAEEGGREGKALKQIHGEQALEEDWSPVGEQGRHNPK